VWNSEASSFIIQNIGSPLSAWNWAIGNIGTKQTGDFIAPDGTAVGSDGFYDSHGTHVDTRSLFHAQMDEKLAVDNRVLREVRLGDADNYVAGDPADTVPVDAAWKTAVQGATGQTGVGFDNVAVNHLVPFTFNFAIDAGSYVVGASLSLGYKSASGSAAGDTIFFESLGRRYTWADLGVAPPTASQGAVVIDLAKLLPALQDGKLNLAVSGNGAIDWATLNFQTASVASPRTTTLIATDDSQVSQAAPTTNFGTSASMNTKRNGATDNFESYLRFDLTGVGGTITNAYVRLVPTTVGVAPSSVATTFGNATGAIFNRLSFVQNDTWTEGALNWNNKPAADPFFREFISSPNEPLLFDVTSLVRAAQAGDKKMSLALSTYIDNASSQITYATSENGTVAFRPQLVIESFDAVGAVADATVRGGASANLNSGTTTDLSVKNDTSASADNDREAYLRFDLNGLSAAPGNAFLRLMPYSVPATLQHSAQLVTDDTWSETGITWNTKPAGSTLLGSWTPVAGQYTSVNVSAAAASAFSTEKLLSVKILSDTASSAAQVQYGSREYPNDAFRPLLISSNLKPTITDIPLITTGLNTPVNGKWFGVWDAETPLNALTVSATSSNTMLLPNANITLAGGGVDRTFSLSPAAGQSGTSNVTITVTDAQGQQAQATFQFTVSSAATIEGDQTSPNQDDTFLVVRNGANVNVFRNAVLVADVAQASAGAFQINGLGGNDTFIIDYSAGNPIPAGGLSLDGGSGANVVRVTGTSAADAVTLTAGNVSLASGGAFAYAAGETLELQLGTGADTLAVAGNSAVTAQTLFLNLSGAGSLSMAASSTLPDFTDVTVATGTTVNIAGQSQVINALAGSGTVLNNGAAAATLMVGSQGSSSTFAGSLNNGTQTLSLTKIGAGTLTLSGTNGYTGVSTLTAGVIESGNAASFAGLAGAVNFLGGTFRVTADTVSANVLNKWTTTFAGATGTNTGTVRRRERRDAHAWHRGRLRHHAHGRRDERRRVVHQDRRRHAADPGWQQSAGRPAAAERRDDHRGTRRRAGPRRYGRARRHEGWHDAGPAQRRGHELPDAHQRR
jgi:autotransporter-associated beta strand protein